MAKKVSVNVNATPLIFAGIVVAVALVIVIVVMIVKAIKRREDNEYFRDNEKAIQRSELSYSDSDYVNLANKLYVAMKGVGTDEDAIFSVFLLMNTESDVRKLVNAFGTKKKETLSEWLLGDLSTNDINKINSILAEKGINYNF